MLLRLHRKRFSFNLMYGRIWYCKICHIANYLNMFRQLPQERLSFNLANYKSKYAMIDLTQNQESHQFAGKIVNLSGACN